MTLLVLVAESGRAPVLGLPFVPFYTFQHSTDLKNMSAPTPTASAAQTGVAEQQHPIDSLHGPGKVEVERTGATPAATTPASTTTTEPRTTGTEKVETPVAAAPERTESKRDVERKEPVSEEGAAAPAAAADDDIPVNVSSWRVRPERRRFVDAELLLSCRPTLAKSATVRRTLATAASPTSSRVPRRRSRAR